MAKEKKYHISNGKLEPCRAKVKPCPKGDMFHFTDTVFGTMMMDTLNKIERDFTDNKEDEYTFRDVMERGEKLDRLYTKREMVMFDTYNFYIKDKEEGIFTEERKKQHKEIIEYFVNAFKNVPNERQCIFSAGIPGAGKTTVLKNYADINLKRYAMLNPDDIKEKMCEMNMYPKMKGLTPLECSTYIHEESAYLTKKIFNACLKDGKNIIYDFTCSSESSFMSKYNSFIANGYKNISLHFVDVSVETSKNRCLSRYLNGLNAFKKGQGHGGRYIPENILEKLKCSDEAYSTVNAKVVSELKKKKLKGLKIFEYDNNGREPIRKH